MDIPIRRARPCKAESQLVRLLHDVIDLTLPYSKFSAAWICTGEVRSIVGIALGTSIHHEETTWGDDLMVRMVMQCLAVLRKDRRE